MSNCKVCLCSKPRKDVTELSIFENGVKRSYSDVILFCLGIKMDENSTLSRKLCVKCFRKIIDFYHFKSLAVKNNAQFLSLKNDSIFHEIEVKKEEPSDTDLEEQDDQDEPLIHINENDLNLDQNIIIEMKNECKQEAHSDDELLSVIKAVKYNSETKENEPIKKKRDKGKNRGRPKMPKKIKQETKPKVCEECGIEVMNLKHHMLKHIPVELRKNVKCELCDKVFCSKIIKQKHIKTKHLNMKKKCPMCDKSVVSLKTHIKTIHEKESLPYKCVDCDLRFLTQNRLNTHLTIHTKDRPFHCSLCPSKFRLKLSLDNHRRQVHEKERSHLCQFCSKRFFKKNHLQIHLRSHTNEKPYQCTECGKHFQSSTTLRAHKLIHSKDKNFNCTFCDSSFVSRSYLQAHLLSHTKEKRYPCQYCGVKFHRSDHRKRHEFTAHLKHGVGNT